MQYLGATSKNDRMISVHSQGKPFNLTAIQAYASTTNAEEAEVDQFYEDLEELLELTPKNKKRNKEKKKMFCSSLGIGMQK